MLTTSLFAFLHHAAAFTLVGTLCVEFSMIRKPLSVSSAQTLIGADALFGASAGAVLILGLLRVFMFEKGAGYYFSNVFFLSKLALFVVIGLLSIGPTREFLSWRKTLKSGQVPVADLKKMRSMRRIIRIELAAVTLLIACAVLMAEGVGSFR